MIHLHDYSLKLPSGENLFQPIEVALSQGELLIVHGRNGSGKSTLLQHLAFKGVAEKLLFLDPEDIFYFPQKYGLDFDFPFTLKDALLCTGNKKDDLKNEVAYKLFNLLHLERHWATASGGERKKTLLLRALTSRAKLLLLDEPFNHLDQKSKEAFIEDIKLYLETRTDACVVIVAHEDLSDSFDKNKMKILELHPLI